MKKITILGFHISFQTPFEKFWAYLGQVQYTKPVCVAHPPPKAPYMKPNISYTDTTMPKLSFIHCMQIAFAPDQFCFCISIFGVLHCTSVSSRNWVVVSVSVLVAAHPNFHYNQLRRGFYPL